MVFIFLFCIFKYVVTFLFSLKTFGMPGPIIFGVIGAPLFGFKIGLLTSSLMSMTGAGTLYLLSKYLGKHYVEKNFPSKI